MPFVYLILAFAFGVIIAISGMVLIPNLFDRLFRKKKKKIFKIVFKLDYYQQPSLFSTGAKGSLVKSPPITVRIAANDEDEALHTLDGIIKQETKAELVNIREWKSDPEDIETLKEKIKPSVIKPS